MKNKPVYEITHQSKGGRVIWLRRVAPKCVESTKTVARVRAVQHTHGARGKVAHIAALESYGNELTRRGMRSEGDYFHKLARQRRHA
jgi:hypothetical protein